MKNRQMILTTSTYDFLCIMNKTLQSLEIPTYTVRHVCIMDALGYKHYQCNLEDSDGGCSKCIQSYLNDEYVRRS